MAGHNSRYKTLLNSSDFPSVVRRLHFTGSKLTIICSLMTTLKTCIRTITYLSDIGCLKIQGASLKVTGVFHRGGNKRNIGGAESCRHIVDFICSLDMNNLFDTIF